MELIEQEALVTTLKRVKWLSDADGLAAVQLANTAPAIDAAPVVHARWICDNSDSLYQYHCSVCKKQGRSRFDSYCPNCGCKMDGGEGHG